jgi:hypothetical protein
LGATSQRVPTQSSAQLRVVLQNAERRGIERLVTDCRDELRVRGGLELDASTARRSVEQALAVSGKPLMDVVEAAFVSIPPRDYEVALLKVLVESVLTGRDRSRAFARGAELILIPIAGFVISALCEAYGLGWRLAVHWRSELAEANGSPRVPRVSPHRRLKRRSRHMYKLVNNNR